MIEFNDEYRNSIGGRCVGVGQYIVNGEAVEIHFLSGPGNEAQIVDAEAYMKANQFSSPDITFFIGKYKYQNEKLYIQLFPHSQEKTGYEQLVFERVEDCALEE
jgi:hypothetical protein